MKRSKYRISDKEVQEEVWVCEACKKANSEKILTGKWKLIDRRNDARIKCGICGNKKSEKYLSHPGKYRL